ncbi:MAG: nickel transporter permease [Trueperaceae bacterium]
MTENRLADGQQGEAAVDGRDSRRYSPTRELWKSLLTNKRALAGGAIVILLVVVALLAPQVSPYDHTRQDIANRLSPPSPEHWLGTDELGRDVLSRIIYGARTSLTVGGLSVAVAMLLGVVIGAVSGYFGGTLDDVLMRIADVFLAIPGIVLAIALVAVLGASTWNVILALGITEWVNFARVVRGQVLSVREREYVVAARASGAAAPRILMRHVLPNVASSVIVMATLSLATMIIAEASLGYLGLGVPPPQPTWGGMLNTGQRFIHTAVHLSVFPGLFIVVTVLGVNLFGDALRDLLDPKLGRD